MLSSDCAEAAAAADLDVQVATRVWRSCEALPRLQVRVLMLEAGIDARQDLRIRIPAGLVKVFKTKHDWDFETRPDSDTAERGVYLCRGKARALRPHSEPQRAALRCAAARAHAAGRWAHGRGVRPEAYYAHAAARQAVAAARRQGGLVVKGAVRGSHSLVPRPLG